MAYRWFPVNIVGQSYESRSKPYSVESTKNLIPEINPTGRTPSALHNWPGSIRRLASVSSGKDRGSNVFQGRLYKVSGTSLYRVDADYTETSIGTIAGSGRCVLSNDGENLVIVTGSIAYNYNGSTLSEITDADLETPDSVAVLNNQMIYDGNRDRWVVATAGEPTDIPDINYALAESNGDDLVRAYVFNQTLYLMGTKTIETWYNSGVGTPPFSRVDGGIIETLGLFALHSVANTSVYMYFLASDKNVYRVTGYQAELITPPATSHQLFKLAGNDAIATTVNIDAQDFYIISFPSVNRTFAYSEQFGEWFDLSTGEDEARYIMNQHHYVYGKRLITDHRNGNVLELDYDTYTDDGLTQIRQRDLAPINGIKLGAPGQKMIMDSFRLIIHTGVGISSGQGSDPKFYVGTSVDGGRNFDYSGNPYISPGEGGNYTITVQLDKILEFEDLIVRVRVSDPVFVSIHGAAIHLDTAGEW